MPTLAAAFAARYSVSTPITDFRTLNLLQKQFELAYFDRGAELFVGADV